MYFKTREEEVMFLKKLWSKEKVPCPVCGHEFLEYLHKKAKKSTDTISRRISIHAIDEIDTIDDSYSS